MTPLKNLRVAVFKYLHGKLTAIQNGLTSFEIWLEFRPERKEARK